MRKGICIYFTGITDDECEKGINYRSTAPGAKLGWATRIPCVKKYGKSCDEFLEPTDEQVREREERVKKSQKGMIEAIAVIQEKTKAEPDFNEVIGDKKGTNGFIDCPVCKYPLHYTVAPGNNHIWGKCSKDGCLAWMM